MIRYEKPTPSPKVSIGMPVYNGEKYIREALDSLLAQTFTDFELIISDNASTDGTEAICREYVARDLRIRYVRQSENRGAAANFQFVLDESRGDYFMWAAADDSWLPTFLTESVGVLDTDKTINFVVTKWRVISRFSPLLNRFHIPNLTLVTDDNPRNRVLQYSNMPFKTHKDNLVYAVWVRQAITRVLLDLTRSALKKPLIGGAMNEYALSLYKGAFVYKALFNKKYRYCPPGHILNLSMALAATVIRPFRPSRRIVASGRAVREQHLKNLVTVLELAEFDQNFIGAVVEANDWIGPGMVDILSEHLTDVLSRISGDCLSP